MDAPDAVCTSFVSLLLILVACGVYMIIRVGMIKGSYDILLQEGDYTISEKKLKKKSDAFSGATGVLPLQFIWDGVSGQCVGILHGSSGRWQGYFLLRYQAFSVQLCKMKRKK